MEKTKNGITEGVIWKQLLLFFFPILIGTFFQQLYNTVDTIIVGQFVGSSALAAVGACAALTNVFICVAPVSYTHLTLPTKLEV